MGNLKTVIEPLAGQSRPHWDQIAPGQKAEYPEIRLDIEDISDADSLELIIELTARAAQFLMS